MAEPFMTTPPKPERLGAMTEENLKAIVEIELSKVRERLGENRTGSDGLAHRAVGVVGHI